MKVKKIAFKHFRGFKNLAIDFDPTMNVLIGINGAGKSSILEGIAVLLSRVSAAVISAKALGRQFSENDIKNGEKSTNNHITIEFDEQDYQWNVAKTRKGKPPLEFSSLHGAKVVAEFIQNRLNDQPEASIPLLVYYPVNRAVLDIPLKIRKKHIFDQLTAYDGALTGVENNFRVFFEWFRNREDIENELFRKSREDSLFTHHPFQPDPQLAAVRTVISAFLPGFAKPRIQRQPLRMTIEKDGHELIINQLSDGEKCLLAMVGDLARRLAMTHPDLANPLHGHGIVLIDEIDLHLHPDWQRRILPTLARTFPNCQFILSTHSPQVVSEVQAESIWMIALEPPVAIHPDGAYGLDTNRILEDVMHVAERPEAIKTRLGELFSQIHAGELHTARQGLQQLLADIGDDPELTKAAVLIRRKEIIGK